MLLSPLSTPTSTLRRDGSNIQALGWDQLAHSHLFQMVNLTGKSSRCSHSPVSRTHRPYLLCHLRLLTLSVFFSSEERGSFTRCLFPLYQFWVSLNGSDVAQCARTNTCGTLLSLFVYGIVVVAAAAVVVVTANQIIFQHRCSQFSFSHFREILPVSVSFFLQSRDQCPQPKAEGPLTCPSELILCSSPPRISVWNDPLLWKIRRREDAGSWNCSYKAVGERVN